MACRPTSALTMVFSTTMCADRGVVVALGGERQGAPRGFAGQRIAQRRAGIDEAGAGQMEAHDLHQHLVGIGGAVEGAGAGRVVGFGLGLEQFGAADLALRIELADAALFVVGHAGGHRAGGHEDGRQVAEGQRADEQARHDLVADAEKDRGIEHVVAERDGGRHGDDVAGEQREVHAGLALGDAIAHGGHAAGDLRRGADGARRFLDDVGIELIGLMGAQHVVVGGDDAEVERLGAGELGLVGRRAGGEAVGEIAATEGGAVDAGFARALDAIEIVAPRLRAPRRDAVGDVLDGLEDRHGSLLGAPINGQRYLGLTQDSTNGHVLYGTFCLGALPASRPFPPPRYADRAPAHGAGASASA